jgi:hypothetical protein
MDNIKLRYLPSSKTRDPDWRWKVAGEIVNNNLKRNLFGKDFILDRLILFRICLEKRKDSENIILKNFSDIYEVYQIYAFNTRMKEELEARILGRELEENLCQKFNLDKNLLNLYKKIFFDIDEFLYNENKSYILSKVINFEEYPNLYSLWKLVAFSCGSIALDSVLFNGTYSIEDFNKKIINYIKYKGYTSLLGKVSSKSFADLLKDEISSSEEEQKESKFISEIKQIFISGLPQSNLPKQEEVLTIEQFVTSEDK